MNYKIDTYQDIPYNYDRSLTGKILSGISWSVSEITGFVVVLIIAFMTVGTAIDLCYITLPTVQSLMRKFKWDGSRENKTIPIQLISKAAIRAIEKAYEASDGTSAISIYIKLRFMDYFKAGVIISILMLGAGPFAGVISKFITPILKTFGFIK